jgi:ATP-dependent DNA ligase
LLAVLSPGASKIHGGPYSVSHGQEPLIHRKATLASLLRRSHDGIQFVEHIEAADGATVFAHACKLGLEGIVSKRRGSGYQHGRSRTWLKVKNPASPAMQRVWEEWF